MSESKNSPELLKSKVMRAAAQLLEHGVRVDARIDERENAGGKTSYFQFITSLDGLNKLKEASVDLEGVEVTVTVAAYQGSYTPREALEKQTASSAANAFANFGKR